MPGFMPKGLAPEIYEKFDAKAQQAEMEIYWKNVKKESAHKTCKVEQDRIVASQTILQCTLLYFSPSIMSFEDHDDLGLAERCALHKLDDDVLFKMEKMLSPLFPRKIGEASTLAKETFRQPNGGFFSAYQIEMMLLAAPSLFMAMKFKVNSFVASLQLDVERKVQTKLEKPRSHLFLTASKFNHACFIPTCIFRTKRHHQHNI